MLKRRDTVTLGWGLLLPVRFCGGSTRKVVPQTAFKRDKSESTTAKVQGLFTTQVTQSDETELPSNPCDSGHGFGLFDTRSKA
jgi:hypothetical protein